MARDVSPVCERNLSSVAESAARVYRPATQSSFVVDAGREAIVFLLRAQNVNDHLVARGRAAAFRMPRRVERLQVDAAKVRTLCDWGKPLVDAAARGHAASTRAGSSGPQASQSGHCSTRSRR
jgi:hypothetical protein